MNEAAGQTEPQSSLALALRAQVLAALEDLLLGFEAADRLAGGALLDDYQRGHLQEVHAGLVTALLRMVFALFAEDSGLLPTAPAPDAGASSLAHLHAQLSDDHRRHGDAMDHRHGAWARVIGLFRVLHGGFFDPDRYPFLEGRRRGSRWQPGERLEVPRVSDATVLRVLDRLLVLGGERLHYGRLDVEQLGGVYEGLMGFDVKVATEDSPQLAPRARARASPWQRGPIQRGSLHLQPSEERRRTGSHYTPRALTQSIVETALRPVLERLGPAPAPEQILDLRVCDPAMGSGAFLVEACRQLADALVAAWQRTGAAPELPTDEDPALHARRLVAQRCLYGVDKNPLAVDLARLSLWLVTAARRCAFTFVDHALRCGDALVGLSVAQIAAVRLDGAREPGPPVAEALSRAVALRERIRAADPQDDAQLVALGREAERALSPVRARGDLVIAAYFSDNTAKARRRARERFDLAVALASSGKGAAEPPFSPFHWEIELPEVFCRERGGFDCIFGNPPFLGGKRISTAFGVAYRDWLADLHVGSSSNADLVAHFYRRAFDLLRPGGSFGLLATNTIAQGDTRAAGLRWICEHGGVIYAASRRKRWPGDAVVIVSVVHVAKQMRVEPRLLDGRTVREISAFLLHIGGHGDPVRLASSSGKSFIGCFLRGMGFTFDDSTEEATPVGEMLQLIAKDARNRERILPYVGGEEVNTSPTHAHHRYVIHFGGLAEHEMRRWPDLAALVEAKVRPGRESLGDSSVDRAHKQAWWRFANDRPELYAAIRALPRVLVIPRVSRHLSAVFLPPDRVFSDQLVVLSFDRFASFCVLQSRVHEIWARCFASTLGDGLRYNPTDCFETFPLPPDHEARPALEQIGRQTYELRAGLMVSNDEGLTKTYNRFHDPDERSPGIARLRALHAAMDRAVLDAYGFNELDPDCDFRQQLDETVRFTWAEDARDELLARLLERNRVAASREPSAADEATPAGERPTRRLKAAAFRARRA